jgi:GTP-binding protein YchF
MALRCGIVGLPNIGKSTLFNALTDSRIAAENYPFCTIEPNSGIVPVPDARLAQLDAIVHSARIVPATVEFVDIAGLVRGASQGEGLGNKFLAHIRETAAIIHVVRCFEDPDVVHVDGRPDPLRDVETIDTELALADLDTAEKRAERARKVGKSGDKEAQAECAFFEKLVAHLSAGKPARTIEVPDAQARAFRESWLLTAKPVLYVANVDEPALAGGNAFSNALEAHARATFAGCVRICAKVEAELVELESAEREAFLAELGADASGLSRLIGEAYRLLDLISYFTAGPKEVRAWTIRRGTKAPQAAAEIHTDFERGFIRAEVIPFDDYVACNGEVGAKERGKMRVEGKDYVVADGDVMHFRIGT